MKNTAMIANTITNVKMDLDFLFILIFLRKILYS